MRTLMTKEARNNVNALQFARLEATGLKKEVYKTLTIFWGIQYEKPTLKIFRGNSTKSICYYYYRNIEQLKDAIVRYKENEDRLQAYKDERKKETKRLTGAAACADAVRKELKELFPAVKFSVRSETYSGGDSVNVSWFDEMTTKTIEEVIKKYQYGHFDGMYDIYENSNCIDGLPQCKYIFARREISEQRKSELMNVLAPLYEDLREFSQCHSFENFVYRVSYYNEFKKDSVIKGVHIDYKKHSFPEIIIIDFE